MLPLNDVIHLAITGIAQGCAYGLIALGFVLIYKATGRSSKMRSRTLFKTPFGRSMASRSAPASGPGRWVVSCLFSYSLSEYDL